MKVYKHDYDWTVSDGKFLYVRPDGSVWDALLNSENAAIYYRTRKEARQALAKWYESQKDYVWAVFDNDDISLLMIFKDKAKADKYARNTNRQYEAGYNPVIVCKQEIVV